MKKVIFLCLLSLSACLSEETASKDAAATKVNATTMEPKMAAKSEEAPHPVNMTETTSQTAAKPTQTEQAPGSMSNEKTEQKVMTNTTATAVPNETKQNATAGQEKVTKAPETMPPKNETVPTETGKSMKNETVVVDDKEKKPMNGTKKEDAMKATDAPVLQTRAFDSASFVGGIIMTLGLIAITFMGYKYYKNQTERNYYGTL